MTDIPNYSYTLSAQHSFTNLTFDYGSKISQPCRRTPPPCAIFCRKLYENERNWTEKASRQWTMIDRTGPISTLSFSFHHFDLWLIKRKRNSIFTARKRSLGQGNMFTGMCLSTGGCMVWGGAWFGGGEGVHGPGGVWSGGVHGAGVHGPGGCLVETPRRLLLRAARILLECILVD